MYLFELVFLFFFSGIYPGMELLGHMVDLGSIPGLRSFPGGLVVKNLPAMQKPQETWVRSLGWKDPLKEGTGNHSSILSWRSPWTEEPGGL